jgi:hypothetical protein
MRGVNLGFLLSFCANSSSLVLNHLSISSFVGFHGLNIPLYVFILCDFHPQIPSTQSCAVTTGNKTICWMFGLTQVLILVGFQQNAQTIAPSGKPEGNTVHKVQSAVSPEIALWGIVILMCFQSRNGLRLCFYPFPHTSTLLIHSSKSSVYSFIKLCMHALIG